jgi:hypothetical protein
VTQTRRLAAILAADIVGYSRLMGEDEAGTARPIVAGLGGRIVKTTGDGFLLEVPSVVAAVECAIAIQKLMVERSAESPDAKQRGQHCGAARRPFASRAACWFQPPLTNPSAAGSTWNLSISARRSWGGRGRNVGVVAGVLRGHLIEPGVASHHGRTGDGRAVV